MLTNSDAYSIVLIVDGNRIKKRSRQYARVAQLVERDLAKVEAAGSSPVSRSENPVKYWIFCCLAYDKNVQWTFFSCLK